MFSKVIYFDENLPRHLAEGFQLLQLPEGIKTGHLVEVKYIPTAFHRGIEDLEWIPLVGKAGGCVITQDLNISRRKHEMELYQQHGLGMFFIRGASRKQGLSVWQMVQTLARHWPEIARITHEEERPFSYLIKQKGSLKKI